MFEELIQQLPDYQTPECILESLKSQIVEDTFPPVARMPWIPTKTSAVKLEESKYYTEMIASNPDKCQLSLRAYKLMNDIFPFYLPKRYHAMDCKALQQNSKNHQYWANATHFFLSHQLHNQNFLGALLLEMVMREDLTLKPLISPETRAFLFKDGLEQCESAAEFILEPWVLVQLPFQPLLLHQWLVAVLAETLKFKTEMVEFKHMAVPNGNLNTAVSDISFLIYNLEGAVTAGFLLLDLTVKRLYAENPYDGSNDKQYLATTFDIFKIKLINALPALEFVLVGKARDIVRALKRMSMTAQNPDRVRDARYNEFCSQLDHFNYIYGFSFWKRADFKNIFKGQNYVNPMQPEWSHQAEPDWEQKMKKKHGKKACWKDVRNFVDNEIVQPGRIKGVGKKVILGCVENDMMLLYYYKQYNKYIGTSSRYPGIREEDYGVLYNIITLTSDYHIAKALAAVTDRLHYLLFVKKHLSVQLNPVECEGPDMSMVIIDEIVKAVICSKKWTNILDMIKTEKVNAEERCPNLDKLGPQEVASVLESRIKAVVYKMIEHQHSSFDGKVKIYHECQFVQYIMPCLVASFLDVANDPSFKQKKKKVFLQFIHELLKSFEESKNFDAYSDTLLLSQKSPYTMGLPNNAAVLYWQTKGIAEKLSESVCGLKSGNPSTDAIWTKFLQISVQYIQHEKFYSVHGGRGNFERWTGKLFRLLARMQAALRNVLSPKGQAEPPLDKLFKAYTFCRILKTNMLGALKRFLLEEEYIVTTLLEEVAKRIFILKGGPFASLACTQETNKADPQITAALAKMSVQEILGQAIYCCTQVFTPTFTKQFPDYYLTPFHLDPSEVAFYSYLKGDIWKVKQILSIWLNDDEGTGDLSLESYSFARNEAALVYKIALKNLTPEKKVKMSKQGEITFFPLVHCRWCGLVEEGEKFRVCALCKEHSDYPDKNFFCSEKCELEAMTAQHEEEHARYLMVRLMISD